MSPVRILVALFVLALALPAAAQITEKQAVAQVKAAAKAQLKAFKATCSAALSTLDANLKSVEGSLDEGSTAADIGSQFTSLAVLFVSTVDEALANARNLVDSATQHALEDLQDGGDLAGLFPADLYHGTGGVLDDSGRALEKAAVKSRNAAVKRLAKAAALAEKKAGLVCALELRLPVHRNAKAVNPSGLIGLEEGVLLDVVITCSDLDAAGDGLLYMAGSTGDQFNDVTVGFFTASAVSQQDSVTPSPEGRFLATFSSLGEGGYCVYARQATGLDQDTASIGVR